MVLNIILPDEFIKYDGLLFQGYITLLYHETKKVENCSKLLLCKFMDITRLVLIVIRTIRLRRVVYVTHRKIHGEKLLSRILISLTLKTAIKFLVSPSSL